MLLYNSDSCGHCYFKYAPAGISTGLTYVLELWMYKQTLLLLYAQNIPNVITVLCGADVYALVRGTVLTRDAVREMIRHLTEFHRFYSNSPRLLAGVFVPYV